MSKVRLVRVPEARGEEGRREKAHARTRTRVQRLANLHS